MSSSSVSISSIEAPSDEERNIEGKLYSSGKNIDNAQALSYMHTKTLPRPTLTNTQHLWSMTMPRDAKKGAKSATKSPRRGLLYDHIRSTPEGHTHYYTEFTHHNLAGALHFRTPHHKSHSLYDQNERYTTFCSRPQHDQLSSSQLGVATNKTVRSKKNYTRAILAFNNKNTSTFVKIKIISAFVLFIIFLSVIFELGSLIYINDSSPATQIPSVAYGVAHGREIPFPPKSREKASSITKSISIAESANGVQLDAREKVDPSLLLDLGFRTVVDAPKFIPNKNGKRPIKPIVAYARKGHNFQPKFVVADGSNQIKKFVLDESRPFDDFQRQDDKFITSFSFQYLAPLSILIAFLLIRRSRNRRFYTHSDFVAV